MLDPVILVPAVINGLTMGAVYALVALGLTLIYGVLHIINFAHGSLLMVGLYGVFFLNRLLGVDPYAAMVIIVPALFGLGYAVQRSVIGRIVPGSDQNVLLITLGVSIIVENLALYFFSADTKTIEIGYAGEVVDLGVVLMPLPRLIGFVASLVLAAILWALIARSDLGRAIRAVAREPQGARLVGIDVEHVFAMSFGIGTACLGAAACLLLPMFYVSPHVGHVFVLVAFTVVVLGGMGSFVGALIGGLLIGVTESLGGLILGESLSQLGIFVIFIAVLLFRPTGLFGARPT
jgi:branched-chain amino acid transport system permease protein